MKAGIQGPDYGRIEKMITQLTESLDKREVDNASITDLDFNGCNWATQIFISKGYEPVRSASGSQNSEDVRYTVTASRKRGDTQHA